MTKEEAIRILKNFSLCGVYHQLIHMNDTDSEAISMAIKALEQPEPCEDAISRQAVFDEAFEVDTKEYGRIDVVGVDAIVALPPVTPQPKTGHLREQARWIPCSERLPVSDGIYIVDDYRHGKHWIHTVGYMKRSNSWCEQHGIYYDDKYGRYDKQEDIIAWMPLPEAYGGEQ